MTSYVVSNVESIRESMEKINSRILELAGES